MCNPTLALGMQAVGGAASTVGSYFEARGERSALNAQASIDDINARIAERSAQSEILQGQREEQRSRLATTQLKSTQRASLAANGVDLGSDSAAAILTTTDIMGEVDANTIAANAARSAWGYRAQGTSYQNSALMKRASARGISPWMRAGTSLINSASSLSRDRYLMKRAGVELPKTWGEFKDSFWG